MVKSVSSRILFDRLAAKNHFHRVLRREELGIHRWNIVVVNIVAVFGLIFPVHYQLHVKFGGHHRADYALPDNKRLERVQQVVKRIASQKAVQLAVWRKQDVVMAADVAPVLKVLPADRRV